MATIVGTAGNDTLAGTSSNDTISGFGGNDVLLGAAGNDSLRGNDGTDWLEGGAGSDNLGGGGGQDSFVFREAGSANADVLSDYASNWDNIQLDAAFFSSLGASGRFASGDGRFVANSTGTAQDAGDRIVLNTTTGQLFYDADGNGSGAAQHFATLPSGRTVIASDFWVFGTAPSSGQTINGTSGDDSFTGGPGNDTIRGGQGFDRLDGAGGNDLIEGETGSDLLRGGEGNDTLLGGDHGDALEGGAGDDRLDGGLWLDRLFGGDGNDVLIGGSDDTAADDTLDGGAGIDTLEGGGGGDHYVVTPGDVIVENGIDTRKDTVESDGSWTLAANLENLFLTGTGAWSGTGNSLGNVIVGNDGANVLRGGTGADRLHGAGGDDMFFLSPGDAPGDVDSADGGDGFDTLDFSGLLQSAIVVNLTTGRADGGGAGGAGTVGIIGVEAVITDAFNDRLIGDGGANLFDARGGDDTLDGGAGNDTLNGGSGADRFVFTQPPGAAHADRVTDFASGTDKIELSMSVSGLGAQGDFAQGDARFHAAAGANSGHDADDRIIYNTSTGELWYDADGSAAGSAQLLAILQGAPLLQATDLHNAAAIIQGGGGDDLLVGTANPDMMAGAGGNDRLSGREGNDTLDGGAGNDSLIGEEGADHLIGGDGNDVLNGWAGENFGDSELVAETMAGGLGDDLYYADHENDSLSDDGGIDTVQVFNMRWTLGAGFENLVIYNDTSESGFTGIGNELDNRMSLTYEAGRLEGRGGNDTLIGAGEDGFGGNHLFGGEGNDSLAGAESTDELDGGAGNDTLAGGALADRFVFSVAPGAVNADQILDFDSVEDEIVLDGAVHASSGPSGNFAADDARFAANSTGTAQDASDRVIYNTSSGQLWYDADGNGAGTAQLIATLQAAPTFAASDVVVINGSAGGQVINGTSGNDTLSGGPGNDTINGLGGNDLFLAGSTGGADVIDGGLGFDSIEFKERATSAITVDFNSGTITGGSAGGSITFSSIERILTGNFNDTLSGNAASQTLTGQNGNDTLAGAGAADTLWGGAGADAFVFREMGTANADRISDFASGQDKVQLDDAAFTSIGALGNFAAGDARFWASSSGAAHDANDRVLYNTSTGQLYYDADGSGSGAAQLIATMSGNPTVAATDIAVI